MTTHQLPYRISHVQLDAAPSWPTLPPQQQGQYVVFWWQEIALGHLFIQPGDYPAAAAYQAAIVAAIEPAVAHYAALAQQAHAPWQAWLSAQQVAQWHRWMQAILAAWLPGARPSQVPVTVIVCTRNRATQLRRCLQQLQALPCAPAEIVVVDNAPADASTRHVAQEFAGVTYVEEHRAGLDIARNTGIKTAQQPVVAFVDDDVVVHPWLLYRVWEAFEEPGTVALTGLVLALALDTEAQLIFERHWSFNRGYVDKLFAPGFGNPAAGQAPPVWEIGAGANMAFRKSVFEEIGYFHELLDVGAAGCSGDSELWHRLLAHGYAIQYNPRAIVYHEHRATLAGLKHQLFYYMRGHVAAALIQHEQQPAAGYQRHVYRHLPRYYAQLLRGGLPAFRFRYRTLWAELRGLAAGVAYYYRTRPPRPTPLP